MLIFYTVFFGRSSLVLLYLLLKYFIRVMNTTTIIPYISML